MALNFLNHDTFFLPRGRGRISAWLRSVAAAEGYRVGELAVVFTSDAYLLEVNRKYLGHDYHTDIITFDYRDPLRPKVISGDLLISVDTVGANAAKFGVLPGDELLRVMVHGVLHLCGYKDKSASEREQMRGREDFYLAEYFSAGGSPDIFMAVE